MFIVIFVKIWTAHFLLWANCGYKTTVCLFCPLAYCLLYVVSVSFPVCVFMFRILYLRKKYIDYVVEIYRFSAYRFGFVVNIFGPLCLGIDTRHRQNFPFFCFLFSL